MFLIDKGKPITPNSGKGRKSNLDMNLSDFLYLKSSPGTEILNIWKRPEPDCSFYSG